MLNSQKATNFNTNNYLSGNNIKSLRPFSYIPDSPDAKLNTGNESQFQKLSIKKQISTNSDLENSYIPKSTQEKNYQNFSPPKNFDLDQDVYLCETVKKPSKHLKITCNFCNTRKETITTYKNGKNTYFVIVLLLILFFPLVWFPCTSNRCKDRIELCSVCNRQASIIAFKLF